MGDLLSHLDNILMLSRIVFKMFKLKKFCRADERKNYFSTIRFLIFSSHRMFFLQILIYTQQIANFKTSYSPGPSCSKGITLFTA